MNKFTYWENDEPYDREYEELKAFNSADGIKKHKYYMTDNRNKIFSEILEKLDHDSKYRDEKEQIAYSFSFYYDNIKDATFVLKYFLSRKLDANLIYCTLEHLEKGMIDTDKLGRIIKKTVLEYYLIDLYN